MPLRLRLLPSPDEPAAGSGSGPPRERAVELPDETREIRIGRRGDIEVPLPYAVLSSLHARLTRLGPGWQVEDLGSTNGTRLNGEPLVPHQPRPIAPGAQIAVGPITLIFDGVAPSVRGAEHTASIARRLVADLLAASPDAGAPVLAIADGVPPFPPLRLAVLDRRYVIGRGEGCDMRLASDEVSREHAAIVRRWDGVIVQDLGSKNGIVVNDQTGPLGGWLGSPATTPPGSAQLRQRERDGGELRMRDGDLLRIGPATLRLSDPADRYLREIEAQERDTTAAAPAPRAVRAAPRPPSPRRRPSGALRAAMAVATGVLVMVVAALLLLAFGR